jgi:hypothetical protein
MTAASYALTIFLYLNSLATSTLAQDSSGDDYDPANERVNNEPEGAVTTSKLQVHVSQESIILSLCVCCASFILSPNDRLFFNTMFNKNTPANCYSVLLFHQSSIYMPCTTQHMHYLRVTKF